VPYKKGLMYLTSMKFALKSLLCSIQGYSDSIPYAPIRHFPRE
jgi:hypothetical protein